MSKITIPDIASQFASQEALNARFTQVENELNNKVLYRDNPDGEPNAMAQELDMNSHRIINLPEPISPNDAARLQDLTTATLDPSTVIPTFVESISLTAGQLIVTFPTYQTEGASFTVSGPNVDDARLVQGRDYSVTNSTSILLTQSYPAGTLIQLLRNAISGDEAADVSYSQVEEIPLVDSQTTAVFSVLSTQYAGFYVSGPDVDAGRLAPSDYSWVNNTTIELAQSYPTGSTLTLLRNSTEADMAQTYEPVNIPPNPGNYWNGGYPPVNVNGVMEIGYRIDFHNSDTDTSDNTYSIANTSNGYISLSGNAEVFGTLAAVGNISEGGVTLSTKYEPRNTAPTSGNYWNGGYPVVGTDGVMDIGQYIDFHSTDGDVTDYTYRMTNTADGGMTFSGDLVVEGGLTVGTGAVWASGTGTPEAVVTAPVGSMFTRTDGGAGSTLYVKESGSGNTGWAAK